MRVALRQTMSRARSSVAAEPLARTRLHAPKPVDVDTSSLNIAVRPAFYAAELDAKVAAVVRSFGEAGLVMPGPPAVFASEPTHFRLHTEFGVWHNGASSEYVMFAARGKPVGVTAFPMGSQLINELMPRVLAGVHAADATLRRGLFAVRFHTTLSGEALVTLIYRCKLDEPAWLADGEALRSSLGLVGLVGRCRGRKLVLGRDHVLETLTCNGKTLSYEQREGLFSQSNGSVCCAMLSWAAAAAAAGCQPGTARDDDLLELYCGSGAFTVALAPHFRRVLATEVSKAATEVCASNLARNAVVNVSLGRVSAEELVQAVEGVRPFERLKHVPLAELRLNTVFVDPPRAGLGADVCATLARYKRIVYISCNPATLAVDVAALSGTHDVTRWALFDQFPYTNHTEMGVLLERGDGKAAQGE